MQPNQFWSKAGSSNKPVVHKILTFEGNVFNFSQILASAPAAEKNNI
jgi:hypothetical protein